MLLKTKSPDVIVKLTADQENDFQKLIISVAAPPVLPLSNLVFPYSVVTDASAYQVGAATLHIDLKYIRRPLIFWSRTLKVHETNHSVTEKEFTSVVWALNTLRTLLLYDKCIGNTDHSSVRWLVNVRDPSGRRISWRLRVAEF